MMRTAFELKFEALNYESAKELVYIHVGRFLSIAPEDVPNKVDTELVVSLEDGKYQVLAYSKIKSNFLSSGLDK